MRKAEVSCNSKCAHNKNDFVTCLKIRSTKFARAVHPHYKELDWKWISIKKTPSDYGQFDCVKEVPTVADIERCCHELLDEMKNHGHQGLATGGIRVETNKYGGRITFDYKLWLKNRRGALR